MERKVIIVKKNINHDELEDLYSVFKQYSDEKNTIDIYIYRNLSKRYFGIGVSIVQFIATWVRYSSKGNLVVDLPLDSSEGEIKDTYFKDEVFFPVLTLVWNETEILDFSNNKLKEKLRGFQNDFFKQMMKVENTKYHNLLLVNYDFVFYHPCFELNNKFIATERHISNVLSFPLKQSVLKFSSEIKNSFTDEEQSFWGIIYELMKNTYEWGRTNNENKPFNPNIRGVFFKFFKKKRNTILSDYSGNDFLVKYFSKNILKENSQGELYFLEISVFDTGAGLVDKFKSSNDTTSLSDIEIIKKCLIKHNTSAQSLSKTNKGIGLDRILKTISEKGFLRIRTDKYSLYRDMIEHPYIETNNEIDMVLCDWFKKSNDEFEVLPLASGTVLTIVYPLAINISL